MKGFGLVAMKQCGTDDDEAAHVAGEVDSFVGGELADHDGAVTAGQVAGGEDAFVQPCVVVDPG